MSKIRGGIELEERPGSEKPQECDLILGVRIAGLPPGHWAEHKREGCPDDDARQPPYEPPCIDRPATCAEISFYTALLHHAVDEADDGDQ